MGLPRVSSNLERSKMLPESWAPVPRILAQVQSLLTAVFCNYFYTPLLLLVLSFTLASATITIAIIHCHCCTSITRCLCSHCCTTFCNCHSLPLSMLLLLLPLCHSLHHTTATFALHYFTTTSCHYYWYHYPCCRLSLLSSAIAANAVTHCCTTIPCHSCSNYCCCYCALPFQLDVLLLRILSLLMFYLTTHCCTLAQSLCLLTLINIKLGLLFQ